ncbi:MAG: sporulation membrane protein YtaF [Desulfobaccales bacterium]
MPLSHLLTILLLALSCNLDNVGVGIAYGARGIGIPLASNLLIALITAAGTGLCIVFGQQIFQVLPGEVGVILGAVLLIGMGVWIIRQEAGEKSRQDQEAPSTAPKELTQESWLRRLLLILQQPVLADQDSSGYIDLKESLLLSMALMLNNIPNGVGAGLLGLSTWLTTLMVGVLSVVTFWVGIGLGRSLGVRWLGRHAGTISGLLLVVIGLVEIILSLPH